MKSHACPDCGTRHRVKLDPAERRRRKYAYDRRYKQTVGRAKTRAYAARYYQEVTKPRREAARAH